MALSIPRRTLSLLALSLTRQTLSLLTLWAALGAGACVQDLDVGAGGSGGAASSSTSSAAPVCSAGAIEPCYDGPAGTEGVAACHSGTRTCAADGLSWGYCAGQTLPDFEPCGAPADKNCDGSTACTNGTGWVQPLGADEERQIVAVAADHEHGLYLAGFVRAQPAPNTRSFLTRIDATGAVIWSKDYDGADVTIGGLAVDRDGNLLVAGAFSGHLDLGSGALTTQSVSGDMDVVVAKLDPSGQPIWAHKYGDEEQQGGDARVRLKAAPNGDAVIYGTFHGTLDFGHDLVLTSPGTWEPSLFLATIDGGGTPIHARAQITDPEQATLLRPADLGMDASGGIVTSGTFQSDFDVGGPSPLQAEPLPSGKFGLYMARYDSQGDFVWQKAFNGAIAEHAEVTPDGRILALAEFLDGVDFGTGELAPAGVPTFALASLGADGGPSASVAFYPGKDVGFACASLREDGWRTFGVAYGVPYAPDGLDLAAIGGPTLPAAESGGALVRVGPDNKVGKVWSYPTPKGDYLRFEAIAEDGVGGIYAVGGYTGAVDFGFGALPQATNRAFVAHYVP